MEHLQSRRDFLKTSAKVMAGVALVSAGRPLLSASAEAAAAPAYPFPYAHIDPDKAAERGYKGYYEKGGCARGVADALIGQLADEIGYPFNQIPIDIRELRRIRGPLHGSHRRQNGRHRAQGALRRRHRRHRQEDGRAAQRPLQRLIHENPAPDALRPRGFFIVF